MMLSSSQKTLTNSSSPLVNRIAADSRESPRVAYLVSNDEMLGVDLGVTIEYSGIRTKWFRSASEYLSYNRPEVPSCLLISQQLLDMPGLNFQRLLAPTSSPPIIFLSNYGDIRSCVQAIKGGALDFLTLPLITPHLLDAMEAAFKKDGAVLQLRQQSQDLRKRWQSLTSREAEVMRYAVGGFLNKQTASELKIAENTVQVHRGRVMRKMCAESFAALVRMSLQLAECGERTLLQAAAEQMRDFPSPFQRCGTSNSHSPSLIGGSEMPVRRDAYA